MKIKTIKWDGKRVTKPGLYANMPMWAYHSPDICGDEKGKVAPSISSSGLRAIFGENTSPKHFFSRWAGNPNRVERPDPRHFIVGRALHFLVLGEPFFAKTFCIVPDEWPDENGVLRPWNANRKTCRKWLAEREKEGRTPLSPREVDQIKNMSISLGNHPLVKQGALSGAIERSLFWKDKETGIWLKSRPDTIPADSADFCDIKSARSVIWAALQHTIDQFGYYRQVSLVRDASRIVLDMEMESFTLLFVEKQNPWHTRDVRVHHEDIDRGTRENRAAIRLFAKCLAEKRWPGPGDGNEGNETIRLSDAARERKEGRLKTEVL